MGKIKVKVRYHPHSGQVLLHDCPKRYRTVSCGRRWGKTVFAVNEILMKASKSQGHFWYIAPTYRQAKRIAWEMFKKYIPAEILSQKPNETELSFDLVNGTDIRLMGADNPESLRGVGLQGVVLDEFADIKREVWTTIIRPMLSDTKGWAIFLGTPKGKINHLYEHFIKDSEYNDPEYRNKDNAKIEIDSDYKSFKFRTVDNPYMDPVEVEKGRVELAPQYFRQEYEASFESYTGIIYKEFDSSKHVIECPKVKDWWRVYVGIDTGRHTAVSFIAVDDKGIMYVFDELYDYDGVVKDIAIQIKSKLANIGRKDATFIIDSASQVKREYQHNGIACYDSEKDVENQIAQVRNAFSKDSLFFDINKCPMHVVEHKGYIWNEKSRKKRPEPVKENDHTCNSVQYTLSHYLNNSDDIPAKKEYQKTMAYAIEKSAKKSQSKWISS